jgi:hypothetical protein
MKKALAWITIIGGSLIIGWACGCAKPKPLGMAAPAVVSPCPIGFEPKGAIYSGRYPNHHDAGILFVPIGQKDLQSGQTEYEVCKKSAPSTR